MLDRCICLRARQPRWSCQTKRSEDALTCSHGREPPFSRARVVLAQTGSFDAAHLFLTHVKGNPGCGMPIPTTETTFEVSTDGRVHHVSGARLKAWIEKRRSEWKGPRGFLFSQRPVIGD